MQFSQINHIDKHRNRKGAGKTGVVRGTPSRPKKTFCVVYIVTLDIPQQKPPINGIWPLWPSCVGGISFMGIVAMMKVSKDSHVK
jgi:hypothetical protein